MPDEPLPHLHLSTRGLPADQAVHLWRRASELLFSSIEPAGEGFEAVLNVFHFKRFLLCSGQLEAARYRRAAPTAGGCQLDHYLLHVPLQAGLLAASGLRVIPGEVVLLDLAEPAQFCLEAGRGMSVLIARDALPLAGHAHGRVLRKACASAGLLVDALVALAKAAPQLPQADAARLSQPLLGLVGACLAGAEAGAHQLGVARPDLARRVRQYIEQNLHRDDLTPATLAKALGTSRSQLYRMFERFGGVRRYLQQRRLQRCLLALGDSEHAGRRIGELAFAHGFADEAHFCKAFRRAFGLSPGAARSALRQGLLPPAASPAGPADAAATLLRWIVELA